jgi:hypothetical protein
LEKNFAVNIDSYSDKTFTKGTDKWGSQDAKNLQFLAALKQISFSLDEDKVTAGNNFAAGWGLDGKIGKQSQKDLDEIKGRENPISAQYAAVNQQL